MDKKVVLITGASSGFGLLTALQFAKEDYEVIATMRDLKKSKTLMEQANKQHIQSNIALYSLDVTSKESIENLRQYIVEKGKIDILINNAGFAGAGFVEDISIDEYKAQLETNFFGTIQVTQALLPMMRDQGAGKIINISSISGKVGFPGLSPYVASKFALEGWSEALRFELLPYSVFVSLVEPGSFQTNIWTSGKRVAERSQTINSPYYSQLMQMETYLKKNSKNYGDPIVVAKKVVAIAKMNYPKLRYPIGKGVQTTIWLRSILPWKWWEKMVLLMLKK